MKKSAVINNLTEGNLTKTLITFAIPFMLSNVLQAVYNLVDMWVLGQFVGSDGISAAAIGGQVSNLLMVFCTGFSTGGQILIAQLVGGGERKRLGSAVGTLFFIVAAIAVVFTVLGIVFANPLLRLLNAPAESFEQAKSYMVICCSGLLFIYGYNAVCAVMRGMGDSRRPFTFIAIASVINLIFDLLFVGVFHMGAGGAAIATVMGQAVAFGYALVYLYRRREAFGFDFKPRSFIPERGTLLTLVKIGVPLALQSMAVSISTTYVSSRVNTYGVAASAISGVGGKLRSIPGIIMNAIGQAGSAIIAQLIGAKKHNKVKSTVLRCIIINGIFAGTYVALSLIFPKQIIGFFTTDPDVLELAPMYMQTTSLGHLCAVFMSPFNAVVNGVGFAGLSMVIGIIDGVVARITFSTVLGGIYGLPGFFVSDGLAGWVAVLISGTYFFSGKWKKRRLLFDVDEERETPSEAAEMDCTP